MSLIVKFLLILEMVCYAAVLDHRVESSVPSTPSARLTRDQHGYKQNDSCDGLDVSCDSNSFTAIMSEGESSTDGEEGEESGKQDTHIKARERFIQDAKERMHIDQHCMYANQSQ